MCKGIDELHDVHQLFGFCSTYVAIYINAISYGCFGISSNKLSNCFRLYRQNHDWRTRPLSPFVFSQDSMCINKIVGPTIKNKINSPTDWQILILLRDNENYPILSSYSSKYDALIPYLRHSSWPFCFRAGAFSYATTTVLHNNALCRATSIIANKLYRNVLNIRGNVLVYGR